MERREPSGVRTEATLPRVKLETSYPEPETEDRPNQEEEGLHENSPLQENDTGHDEQSSGEDNERIEDVPIDAGAVEIDDIDEYHPGTLTPGQQLAHGNRSPILTRSRARQQPKAESTHLIHYAMAQVSMKAGIKKWGQKAKDGVQKELNQFHYMSVFHSVMADTLSEKQKNEAVKMLMFLKEKNDDSIKGRGCADGRMQKNKYEKKK